MEKEGDWMMPAHNECPFCYRTYGEAEEHDCEERKEWEKTLIGQATEARKALKEFTDTIMSEAEKSYNTLMKFWKDKKDV
jgi:hypothetical protein